MATIKHFEEGSSDIRNADGYVVIFDIPKQKMVGILAVLSTSPTARSLQKLTMALSSHARLSVQLEGYETTRRQTKQANIYEIKFAVRKGTEHTIQEFLEYAKQARVLKNPIVCDIRDFKPNRDV